MLESSAGFPTIRLFMNTKQPTKFNCPDSFCPAKDVKMAVVVLNARRGWNDETIEKLIHCCEERLCLLMSFSQSMRAFIRQQLQ